jgi:putative DNA primase/helicase
MRKDKVSEYVNDKLACLFDDDVDEFTELDQYYNKTPFDKDSIPQNETSDVNYDDDDGYEIPHSSPRIDLPEDKAPRADRYQRKIAELAKRIRDNNDIIVCNDQLKVYSDKTGCYEQKEGNSAHRFFVSCFNCNERQILTKKVLDEILNQIICTPELVHDPEEFNADPTEMNCLNGIVKIKKSKITLLPHSPKKLFTYCIQARYLHNANQIKKSTFDNFCSSSLENSVEKTKLLLGSYGYVCSDSNAGKVGFFFKGEPDSGKSVTTELLTILLGAENVEHIPLHELNDKFNRAQLFGRKANIQSEMKSDKVPDISTFKAITGGDKIYAQYKHKTPFSFSPRCKLVFAGNSMPGTREVEATNAFRRRIIPLLFNVSIPDEKQDPQLKQKLLKEIDSIFTLAVQEYAELLQNKYKFSLPQDSIDFLNAYGAIENSIRTFIKERCRIDRSGATHNADLLKAYSKYCIENGLEEYSKQKIYKILDNIPGLRRDRVNRNGRNAWGYYGLILEQTEH